MARLELQEATSGSAAELETTAIAALPTRASRLLPALALLLALGLTTLGVVVWRLAGKTQPVVRALVSPPKGGAFYLESSGAGPVAVSPDGTRLAFTARDTAGTPVLWIRDLEDPEPRALPGTEGAAFPFWAPDSQTVAYGVPFSNLYRIDIAGGPPRILCAFGSGKGGTWSDEGVILFTSARSGSLHRVDASGEGCEPLTVADPEFGETNHRLPHFFPDGQRFLYLALLQSPGEEGHRIMIGSLDGTPPRELMRNPTQVDMVAGHLWFVHQGTLVARPFDSKRERITGEPLPIAEDVGEIRGPGVGLFSVSRSGVLAYHGLEPAEKRSLMWRHRSGQSLGTLGLPARHLALELSPDGKNAATSAYEDEDGIGFLNTWLHDVETEISTRFTFGVPGKGWGTWSPSGDRFAVTWLGGKAIEARPVFGGGEGEVLWQAGADDEIRLTSQDWSPDGSLLLAYGRVRDGEGRLGQPDLWVVPLDSEAAPYPLLETPFNEWDAGLSPDGRWLAYGSDETDQNEIYVTSFPEPGRRWQVSKDGGIFPEWSSDGDELFYLDLNNFLMAVAVDLEGDTFVPGESSALFQTRTTTDKGDPFSVSPDAERILIIETQEDAAASQINLLVGWKQLL
jgi:Tol biopolymer transport system component